MSGNAPDRLAKETAALRLSEIGAAFTFSPT
jgi:hypothetical protein